jgi:hypothetical protein
MKDIYCVNTSEGTTLVSQPYLSISFASTQSLKQTSEVRPRHLIKNEMIFALGVTLQELSLGKPILAFKQPEDLDSQGNVTFLTEFSVAHRLIEEIYKRELRNYADAVARCIRCNFDTFSCSLDDGGFRERFYQGVIMPLKKDYEYATSVSGTF